MTTEVTEQVWDFRFQRGTAARWTELNPVLGPAEPGVEIDAGKGFKLGDGHTAWNDLEYFVTESAVVGIVEVMLAESGGESADPRVGNLAELTTEAKDLIVNAINEINMVEVSLVLLYDNAKAG